MALLLTSIHSISDELQYQAGGRGRRLCAQEDAGAENLTPAALTGLLR